MMSVTDDCRTLPSPSPRKARLGHRGQKAKRMGVGEIIISINEALRTIRTARFPDLVSKATSPRSFVL